MEVRLTRQVNGPLITNVVVMDFDRIVQVDGSHSAHPCYVALTRAKKTVECLYCEETPAVAAQLRAREALRAGRGNLTAHQVGTWLTP